MKRSVLYLGHVPHGFYEDQMNGFFSQFGTVTRLRLSRNRREVEALCLHRDGKPDVAQVVADTVDKYFLSGKQLVCNIIPPEKCTSACLPARGVRFARSRGALSRGSVTRGGSASGTGVAPERQDVKKRKQIEELGIEYDFVGYGEAPAVASQSVPAKKKAKKSKTPSKKKAAAAQRRRGNGAEVCQEDVVEESGGDAQLDFKGS